MPDQVIHPENEFITVGDQTYLRSRVQARLQLAKESELPPVVRAANKAVASELHFADKNNPDLVWTKLILDTEGANANRDYMPRPSLLGGYGTAAFKPFNMEHVVAEEKSMVGMDPRNPPVKNTIYGVMTHASLCGPDGGLLADTDVAKLENTDDPGRGDHQKVGVVAWAALYAFLFPKTVADVCDRIDRGEMFVSMERWIAKWDYLSPTGDGGYESVGRAEAEQNGTHNKWALGTATHGRSVLRRSLAFVYGACASTANPANRLCRFVAPSALRAAASANQTILQDLMNRHRELHEAFAVSSSAQQAAIIEEHRRVTRAVAVLTGQL